MERRESLRNLFQDLGCKVESDAVLDKCFEFCESYDVDVEKLTELWLTFCVNNNTDIDPTVDNLIKMERAILIKDRKVRDPTTKSSVKQEQNTTEKRFITNEASETDDVLSMYGCAEDGLSKRARISPEVEISADARTDKARAECSFSPGFYTENSVPSQRSITDKEKILLSVGEAIASWKRTGDYDVEVTKSNESHVLSDARYMYEVLSRQGHLLTFVCQSLGGRLFKTWSTATGNAGELRYVKNVRSVSQTNFRTFGRISAKKESANTVTLEGSTRRRGVSAADTIELDFRNLKQYSVFSGQIVAVEAINPVGDALYVKQIFAKSYAPPALTPMIESRVNVFVAAGPFNPSNSTLYEPLWDLMERAASDEPQLLILVGPFLEYTHPQIQDSLISHTHQELFERILTKIMDLARKNTQVVVVASNRDAHHEPIFPTPHYAVFNRNLLQNYSNLKLMPDPCILDVAGLKIGITSVDVIKHIGKEEISNVSGDRLGRLADHVLAQTCFYPVYPPSEDLNVDTELWEKHAFFDQQPHLMILPSDMRCYCKVINECMIVNPERMHKRVYARLSVKPTVGGKWSSNNISCEIVKV
ncbi:PREDICTED: DNA polymerase alpha subunit B isoform X2 [Wasmannia auropunctata]|uniref:DNA polymerase alpha subunit B isoform X2 n=1 Tax=Wasmannia auropunctata TaxID=64793 RepID=UPI0005EEC44D|nr:PREDICTED: DNA polymerase alpha subunit B isoform X2 [Wasmannia auropunctata]